MIAAKSTGRFDAANCPSTDRGLWQAGQAALAIEQRWQEGEPPDAARALESQPHLRQYPAVVVELACEEYALRKRAGEKLEPGAVFPPLPHLSTALYLKLAAHSILVQDPGLQAMRDDLPWPAPGQRFMQFDLIAEIGRGAFGRVFLANEPVLGNRPIVVKVAPGGGDEAEILAKLQHPNIVPIYSLQEDEETGLAAFCMPYLGARMLSNGWTTPFRGYRPTKARTIFEAVEAANEGFDPSGCLKSRPAGGSYGRLVC